jgi:16S rRNA processing protein RimM
MPDDMIVVGAIAGAFGVRGEVRIKSFCADPGDIATYGPLTAAGGRVFDRLTLTGATSGALVGRLSGITTPEEADRLKGQTLAVPRARLPALPDDEFYHADLIGLAVVDPGGQMLGRVKAVLNHGASDLLEVDRPGAAPVLLPFTKTAVPLVDLATGRLIADPPDGIF